MVKPLIVYKASAGSGKTFTLATEYIKLLIQNPLSYRNILAVTFTNKATEEMKMRILSQLYGIWKQLPDSEQYINKVCRELDVSREQASAQAGIALSNLIHNYNYFRVETIDAFFQTVLRNLARELDLTANLRIGLNDYQMEELAVDKLIESLQSTDQVLLWIMNYITANISDDKNWNVIGQIKSFGKTIFKDFYKAEQERLNKVLAEKDFFDAYTRKLRDIRKQAKETMTMYAEAFFDALEENGLSPDMLKNKQRGISSYFNKLRGDDWSDEKCLTANLAASMESAENWTTKTSPDRMTIIAIADGQLMQLLRDAETARPRQWRLLQSADLTLRHLNQLRLLGSIDEKVRELNRDANQFLLSDTQQLLHSLIDTSDSPFIFEKIGTQLNHVMIDEFQDTSTVQWQNFKVLLEETMSRGSGNLIVGDVKQSIYRWRSGDWRLLNSIEQQFANADQQLETRVLSTNWRSERNIIDFNNCFFTEAVKLEYQNEQEINPDSAALLQKAYQDVVQQVPSHKPKDGLVHISLLPSDNYQEAVLEKVAAHIGEMLQAGIPASKMAILVRTNRYIPLVADYLMQRFPDVKLVSDEAFRLDSSVAVCIMIQAMHLLTHPADTLTRASLAKSWQRQVLNNQQEDNLLFSDIAQLDSLLPPDYVTSAAQLRMLPLMELAERLYAVFGLSALERESAYVCTFFDCIANFVQENTTDIDSFIAEWEETLHTRTIQSDEIDGIRLISIHKSKGLEFDNVIIPFCDWMLEMRGTILWCSPNEEPFSQLPLVPVDYSSKMQESIYAPDYRKEHLQNCVDNLNLLYVAFTRASRNLFVIGRRGAKNSRSVVIEQVLPGLREHLPNSVLNGDEDDGEVTFQYGSLLPPPPDRQSTLTRNVFNQPVALQKIRIETFTTPVEFRQSNQSRDFIKGDDEQSQQQTYIKMGNILHNLFSSIRTSADIPRVLRKLEFDGVLYDEELSAGRIREMLEKRLRHPVVADWFSGRWELFNECTILSVDPDTQQVIERRPDRVMTDGKEMIVVDFKFGRPREEYHAQVGEYIRLLRDMGYKNVQGYLWYVYSNKIETV